MLTYSRMDTNSHTSAKISRLSEFQTFLEVNREIGGLCSINICAWTLIHICLPDFPDNQTFFEVNREIGGLCLINICAWTLIHICLPDFPDNQTFFEVNREIGEVCLTFLVDFRKNLTVWQTFMYLCARANSYHLFLCWLQKKSDCLESLADIYVLVSTRRYLLNIFT